MSFTPEDIGRFWNKVLLPNNSSRKDCFIWKASKSPEGYGFFSVQGKTLRAHRVAFELSNGPISKGLCVLHNCDTPSCVNASHLFLGTRTVNMEDKVAKNRQARGRKHRLSSGQKVASRQSIFKGVCWNKERQKWQAQIYLDGKNKTLGRFASEKEAHQAYQEALRQCPP